MINYLLLNLSAGWAAVCISKNGCTSLKARVLLDYGIQGNEFATIHDQIGYDSSSPFLREVNDGIPEDLYTFAVWRDPVERFKSVFKHYALGGVHGRQPKTLPPEIDAWLDWVEDELLKPVLEQDEHIRRQSDYYRPEQVDSIVPLEHLAEWFTAKGFGELPYEHVRSTPVDVTPAQAARIRRIYWQDYLVLGSLLPSWLDRPLVAGLWIGEELPPLAELCILSFLHHGFRFKLHTYGPVAGVPEGVELADAAGLLDESELFLHHTGSLAPTADRIRYRYLAEHGGFWTDLDVACLNPEGFPEQWPWSAMQDSEWAAVGALGFPPGHPVPVHLERLAQDPANPMPWDDAAALQWKQDWLRRTPDLLQRKIDAKWTTLGPDGFTHAARHFGILEDAAPPSSIYPIPYQDWKRSYDGSIGHDSPELANSWAVHLWGEKLRTSPDTIENMDRDSLVAQLMRIHGCAPAHLQKRFWRPGPPPKILVGVCSCSANRAKRDAVRASWATLEQANVTIRFFTGEAPNIEEQDTIFLNANDSYPYLPSKVMAFFSHALKLFDFDWLFKCDDDTYVDLTRLADLTGPGLDLIGSEVTATRGSPSGGAGYFLSRRMVELLVSEGKIPETGDEDVLIGEEAIRKGAIVCATTRLGQDASRYPRKDNTVVTSHWCSPERLRAIQSIRFGDPVGIVEVRHPQWHDELQLYADGTFTRKSGNCAGTYEKEGEGYLLRWFDWGEERLTPGWAEGNSEARFFRCTKIRSITLELAGGLGNQMFQYAHGLALATATGAALKLSFIDYGRPFALDMFSLNLDPMPPALHQRIEYFGDHVGGDWPTLSAIHNATCPDVRVAGYFQNEEFFRPVRESIRRVFHIEPKVLDDVEGRTPVCVHVRRGDFVNSDTHDLCSIPYFLDAMRLMGAMVANPWFVVISDDPAWCEVRFGVLENARMLPFMPVRETLEVMVGCKAFILSNSTFGWWGAWLADQHPVIAPTKWRANEHCNIAPKNWIALPPEGINALWSRPHVVEDWSGKRLISFSLYGQEDLYCEGLLDNIRVCRVMYPGWLVIVFHDGSPPLDILELARLGGAITIKTEEGIAPEAARFLAAGFAGIERVIFRDTDSLPDEREVECVRVWIDSGMPFHAMRDHPSHTSTILCGMWGCVGDILSDVSTTLREFSWSGEYGQDQEFLEHAVWKPYADQILIHDPHPSGLPGQPFPSKRKNCRFVGERMYRGQPVFDTWKNLKDLNL